MSERLLSPAEVAERLGVSRQSVYALLDSGELIGLRVRGRRKVDPIDLDAYIEAEKEKRPARVNEPAQRKRRRGSKVDWFD